MSSYLPRRYTPLDDLQADSDVGRYAAVKALRFRDDPRDQVVPALENLIRREPEERIALEAAGSAAALGSQFGQEQIACCIWNNDDRPELRMEAVFILTELGNSPFTRKQLNRVVADPHFEGDELRQAAVWALGKAGLKCYEDVLPFIDDADENLALHAIAAFGADTSRPVIDCLIQDLVAGDPRRAPAASEALRLIASEEVLRALISVANDGQPVPDWILATLGRLPPDRVRADLQGSPLLDQVAPMLLSAQGAHWLASGTTSADIAFLLKQNLP